jgi:hypothetical protein
MRFRLRTLLVVLAIGPGVLAGAWFFYSQLFPPTVPHLHYSDHAGLWIDGVQLERPQGP